jgi:hypothetical protein
LTPHFGVAATSLPFSASAKLAVVMDKNTIPHAGGLAASTCRERRRTPAKPAESALSFGPWSIVSGPWSVVYFLPSAILHPLSSDFIRPANPLIIKPHPAQSCLIKPNTATNDFRSQSHQIKPNQTIETL